MHTPPCDDFYITRVTPLFDMYILSKSGYQYFFFAFIISSVLCKNTDSIRYSIVSDVEGLNVIKYREPTEEYFQNDLHNFLGGFAGFHHVTVKFVIL